MKVKYGTVSLILVFVLIVSVFIIPQPVSAGTYKIAEKYYFISNHDDSWLLDMDDNVILSSGRYPYMSYLGGDLFAVYENPGDYNNKNEYPYPKMLNIKTGKKTKIETPKQTSTVHLYPFSNGYAKMKNEAFYSYTTLTYYTFINKEGKLTGSEQPYNFCSDMLKSGSNYYFYTQGVSGSYGGYSTEQLSKRDTTGKVVKTVKIKKNAQCSVVKSGKKFYIRAITKKQDEKNKYVLDTAVLYDLNLNKVKMSKTKIADMKEYTRENEVMTNLLDPDNYVPYMPKESLEYRYKKIFPTTNNQVCMDVCGASSEIGSWLEVYNCVKYAPNQSFYFEKVEEGKYRIWDKNSKRQLASKKVDGVIRLVLGENQDKDNQVFEIIDNEDGSVYIVNKDGKYLTMADGADTSGTLLVFEKFAKGDTKQKFVIDYSSR